MNDIVGRVPSCHPDKKHYAHNLCQSCYNIAWKEAHPGYRVKDYSKHKKRQKAQHLEYYQKNKEKIAEYWKDFRKKFPDKSKNRQLRRDYGITIEDYRKILELQKNCCKLCGISPIKRPVVDHNHKTKKVRGIVCQRCNIAIGHFECFSPIFNKIANYLEVPWD